MYEPADCPHYNTNNRRSTTQFVVTYCTDCCTIIDRRPRAEVEEARRTAKALERSSKDLQRTTSRLVEEDRELDVSQAYAVIHAFTGNANKILQDNQPIMASTLHECLVDAVDTVAESNERRGRTRPPDESFSPTAQAAHLPRNRYAPGIPIVDLKTSPYLWGILDTACNSSLFGYTWRKQKAEPIWKKHGYLCREKSTIQSIVWRTCR